jgi:hypothetical protein
LHFGELFLEQLEVALRHVGKSVLGNLGFFVPEDSSPNSFGRRQGFALGGFELPPRRIKRLA